MNEETVSNRYSILDRIKALFNNPQHSDICFVVGADQTKFHAHRFVLAMGSPVFDRMFYGDVKEKRDVIEIADLSASAFRNILRYIYGFKIDFELQTELYNTYIAADIFLVYHFEDALLSYIKQKLNFSNCFLIYEQLIELQKGENIFAHVRSVIVEESKAAFENEHFTRIAQETLISLLWLENLKIAEIDLLAAVSRWVDCEVQRQSLIACSKNKRRLFEPIKQNILFAALTAEEIGNFKEINQLLTLEEIGSIFLHIYDKDRPLMVGCKTPRKAWPAVCRVVSSVLSSTTSSLSESISLKSDRKEKF